MDKEYITWEGVEEMVENICTDNKLKDKNYDLIIGISRGGLIPATLFAKHLNIREIYCFGIKTYCDINNRPLDAPEIYQKVTTFSERHPKILLVDDLSDRGTTFKYVKSYIDDDLWKRFGKRLEIDTTGLIIKPHTKFKPDYFDIEVPNGKWVVFPWEN